MSKKLRLPPLNTKERYRLAECMFYKLVNRLFEYYKSMGVIPFIEYLCDFFRCDMRYLETYIKLTMTHNFTFRPRREEIAILFYRAGVPVKNIAKNTNYSIPMVYVILNKYQTNPTEFEMRGPSEKHAEELLKFLQAFQKFKELL